MRKHFSKFPNKIFANISHDIVGSEISYCLSANHNPEFRCVICTGVTLFTLVLHLNSTPLSQSESSTFSCILFSPLRLGKRNAVFRSPEVTLSAEKRTYQTRHSYWPTIKESHIYSHSNASPGWCNFCVIT